VGALVDALHLDLAQRVTAIAELPIPRPMADLTGGKDSRLILALLREAGVTDRFRFRTIGAPDLPDAAVARELAEELALDHEALVREPMGPELFVRRLTAHTFQTSGMVSAWDLSGGLGVSSNPVVSGLYAELMRTHYSSFPLLTSMSALRERMARSARGDPGSVLKPDVRAHYQQVHDEELYDRADAGGGSPQDRLDTFFLHHRLRRWSGTTEEIGNHARLYPLYSLLGLRAAFVIGDEARRDGLLHLEVMRRAAPELAQHRFAGSGWPESLLADRPDADRLRPPPLKASPRGAPPWQATRLVDQRKVIADFLLGDPQNPLFDIVDRRALAVLLTGGGPATFPERQQVYGALTAAVWLGQHDDPTKIGTDPDRQPIVAPPARAPTGPANRAIAIATLTHPTRRVRRAARRRLKAVLRRD
jgi:hypothetical protein